MTTGYTDQKYMQRCIELATNGLGTTYPNPLVGCVIVHNKKIIGEGWHLKAGLPHAEINAINSVKNQSLLKDSNIYVSLEPCSHYGITPPCAQKITELQFKRVIIGTLDPNPKVNGQGVKIIENAGIETTVGVLEEQSAYVNKRFNTFHSKQRPYIILKWAETLNKKIDNGADRNRPFWISNKYALQKTHLLRSQEQAILIGKQTALTDNPFLTTRAVSGKNPIRVLIDRNLQVPPNYNIFNPEAQTLIFNQSDNKKQEHLEYIAIDFTKNIVPQIIQQLYLKKIQSLIVEGGRYTLQSFIDANLWDEALITTAPIAPLQGTPAPQLTGTIYKQELLDTNLFSYIHNHTSI